MGMFENVFSKAKSAADYAGRKTGEFVELSKLRLAAAELQDRINKAFQELGYVVYESGKDGSDPSEALKDKSAAIDSLYEQLAAANQKISELRQMKKCPVCDSANPESANYCQKCGAKL